MSAVIIDAGLFQLQNSSPVTAWLPQGEDTQRERLRINLCWQRRGQRHSMRQRDADLGLCPPEITQLELFYPILLLVHLDCRGLSVLTAISP